MLQHLTRGFALRLRYTPSNCISTRRYIELVKIHKTTPLQGLACVIYFRRQFPCVVILACVKPIKTPRRHPFFSLSSSLSLHTNGQIFYLKVGHFFCCRCCCDESFLRLSQRESIVADFCLLSAIFAGCPLKIIQIPSSAELHISQKIPHPVAKKVWRFRLHV